MANVCSGKSHIVNSHWWQSTSDWRDGEEVHSHLDIVTMLLIVVIRTSVERELLCVVFHVSCLPQTRIMWWSILLKGGAGKWMRFCRFGWHKNGSRLQGFLTESAPPPGGKTSTLLAFHVIYASKTLCPVMHAHLRAKTKKGSTYAHTRQLIWTLSINKDTNNCGERVNQFTVVWPYQRSWKLARYVVRLDHGYLFKIWVKWIKYFHSRPLSGCSCKLERTLGEVRQPWTGLDGSTVVSVLIDAQGLNPSECTCFPFWFSRSNMHALPLNAV
jgi:hypothetical protein